jgi:transcriptional regulator with XRE-family HTH domain
MSISIPAATLEKFTTFGDLLRFLRRRVGITQMELATAVGYSDTQISRLEQNQRPPDIPTLEARFISALDLENEPKAVERLLDLAANVRREDAPGLGLCPYKGLNYFDEADADLFVGREKWTSRLTERVLSMTSTESQGPDSIPGCGRIIGKRQVLAGACRFGPGIAMAQEIHRLADSYFHTHRASVGKPGDQSHTGNSLRHHDRHTDG